MTYTITTKDLVRWAHEHDIQSFIVPNNDVARMVATSIQPAIIDLSHFPHWVELRTVSSDEYFCIAIASDVPALQDYACEHLIPIFDQEDQPEYVGTRLNKPMFKEPDDEDTGSLFNTWDEPGYQPDEASFGGTSGDYELLPPIPDHGDPNA